MSEVALLAPLLGPFLLLLVALTAGFFPGLRPARLMTLSLAAAGVCLVVAVAAIGWLALLGSATSPTLGIGGVGLSVRLDPLSATMFALVSFVGVLVMRYSRTYLDGDARQAAFFRDLDLTLAAVAVLVVSGNLVQFVAAWIATSLGLHRLLLFYAERPAAVLAARKKFVAARIGDLALVAGAVLMTQAFGSADIATIAESARAASSSADGVLAAQVAAVFLATAALLKSAQFPTHGWLLEVMETPTPVSALLHAGIINAGGFLIVRFADVVLLSSPSMLLLAVVGTVTAVVGALAMSTQTSVKVSLAYSTIAQMGFMLLQCGLGAFSVAVLHIVAHSLYKAHAFLASGSIVDVARTSRLVPKKVGTPRLAVVGACAVAAAVLVVAIGALFDTGAFGPADWTFGAILVLGLTTLLVRPFRGASVPRLGVVLGAAWVGFLYFALHHASSTVMAQVAPDLHDLGPVLTAWMVVTVVAFAAVLLLQLYGPRFEQSRWYRTAYVHARNGLYANALFNRFIGASR